MHLYEGRDPLRLETANHLLLEFEQSPDCILRCRMILDQSKVQFGASMEFARDEGLTLALAPLSSRFQSAYAHIVAATTLTKLISNPTCPLLLIERLQIRLFD